MVPKAAPRPKLVGAASSIALSLFLAFGCGDAVKTPFFDKGPAEVQAGTGSGGTAQGGSAGTSAGGSDAGTAPLGGSAGTAGTDAGGTSTGGAGAAGSGAVGGTVATGGTGAGGTAGTGVGGTDAGGTAGSGGGECTSLDATAVAFDGHCYLRRNTALTWMAARDDCANHGAHLATISSQNRTEMEFEAENQFVWELGGMTEQWIGMTDGRAANQAGDGTPFTWVTQEPMTFDLWSDGQPNNSPASCLASDPCSCDGSCWEHCGFQWTPPSGDPGTWNDRLCEHQQPFVCEWDMLP
jgi:hypothetical protein